MIVLIITSSIFLLFGIIYIIKESIYNSELKGDIKGSICYKCQHFNLKYSSCKLYKNCDFNS
jgi:prepilin signal peptidase PulO-like enzyme (type II secretory pathway)